MREQDAKRLLGGDSLKTSVKTSVKTPEKILQLLDANPAMTLADVAAEIEKTLRAVELVSSKLVKAVEIRWPAKRRSLGGIEMSVIGQSERATEAWPDAGWLAIKPLWFLAG